MSRDDALEALLDAVNDLLYQLDKASGRVPQYVERSAARVGEAANRLPPPMNAENVLVAIRESRTRPSPNVEGCTCPRFDAHFDEAYDFVFCPKHQRMFEALRRSTLALMYVDLEAALAEIADLMDPGS